jgi:protein phosphatase
VAEHFERSDTGRRRRANEDAFFARSPLFAVADGMGGAQAGEVASHIAVQVLEQGLPEGDGSIEERLRRRVAEANERINEVSRSDERHSGMGTTLTVAYVGEEELSVAHVGDSRLYRLREGRFERLTDDHSLVEELVRQGKLTPAEADEHPQRSIITRALGPEAGVEPDSRTWPAREGDVYLICSDGLTSMVPETDVGEILGRAGSLRDAGRALVDAANQAGGRDNITVVLFRLERVGARAEEGATTEHEAAAPLDDGRQGAGPATAVATRAAAPPITVERRAPRAPRPPAGPSEGGRRRRGLRRLVPTTGFVLTVFLVLCVLFGGYYASQTVYFVGAGDDGFVTVYRGMPYDLPAGLDLYSVNYVSGVPLSELSDDQRRAVASHELRSRDDALGLVRRLETQQVGAP